MPSKLTSSRDRYARQAASAIVAQAQVQAVSVAAAADEAVAAVTITVTGGSTETIADQVANIDAITTRLNNAGIPP